MRNNYNIILGLALSFIAISCLFLAIGVIIGRKVEQNQQSSFPFGEVEVGLELASASLLEKEFGGEYKIIMAAAHRNACVQENMLILFAIRKAENGPPGLEFGVLYVAGTDLDTQAGWAAATIMKNRKRWTEAQDKLFGYKGFIFFLGNKYCPSEVDKTGNINWIRNVTYWYEKFKGKENEMSKMLGSCWNCIKLF